MFVAKAHITSKGKSPESTFHLDLFEGEDDLSLSVTGPRGGYITKHPLTLNKSEVTHLISIVMKAVEGMKDANT